MTPFSHPGPLRRDSLLVRWLAPWAGALWILFLGCTVLVVAVWISQIGDAEVRKFVAKLSGSSDLRETFASDAETAEVPELATVLQWLLGNLEATWLLLAGANLYSGLVAGEGLATARRWMGIVFAGGFVFSALSAWTDWPMGPIAFTGRLGMRLGPVPIGVLMLWCVIILGARELLLRLAPRASHAQAAFGTGALALLSDLNLEPVAWRTFWVWSPGLLPTHPPLPNYATWLIGGTALCWLLRERSVVRSATVRPARLIAVFLIVHGALLVANVARFAG